ncbi:hypothetical protein GCM10010329_49710 [Streptomyces spiroverticillatus]|uniref:Uncharacterized protein n=1 Tax=Streptomyces finlayi TaxID=67296 RepID=A0A918X1C5_9ACTN|nr:hypothetical protein GCM10010329_49710 [Streptomyces spiroverticillatus]GHD03199.1 hypothetical protein GCM10010334_50660 [Streptomyces finlayi]
MAEGPAPGCVAVAVPGAEAEGRVAAGCGDAAAEPPGEPHGGFGSGLRWTRWCGTGGPECTGLGGFGAVGLNGSALRRTGTGSGVRPVDHPVAVATTPVSATVTRTARASGRFAVATAAARNSRRRKRPSRHTRPISGSRSSTSPRTATALVAASPCDRASNADVTCADSDRSAVAAIRGRFHRL